jgi:hypothetical protein
MKLLLELETETEDGFMVSRMAYADIEGMPDDKIGGYLGDLVLNMKAKLKDNVNFHVLNRERKQ